MSRCSTGHTSPAVNVGATAGHRILWCETVMCPTCTNCITELRISQSTSNPMKLYYKCRFCGWFQWVDDHNLIKEDDMVPSSLVQLGFDVVKNHLARIEKRLDLVFRICVICLFVVFAKLFW